MFLWTSALFSWVVWSILSPTASTAALALYCVLDVAAFNCDDQMDSLPSANGSIAVLGNLLVGLLADTRCGALDGLSDVVESLLGGLHCEGSGGCSSELFERWL